MSKSHSFKTNVNDRVEKETVQFSARLTSRIRLAESQKTQCACSEFCRRYYQQYISPSSQSDQHTSDVQRSRDQIALIESLLTGYEYLIHHVIRGNKNVLPAQQLEYLRKATQQDEQEEDGNERTDGSDTITHSTPSINMESKHNTSQHHSLHTSNGTTPALFFDPLSSLFGGTNSVSSVYDHTHFVYRKMAYNYQELVKSLRTTLNSSDSHDEQEHNTTTQLHTTANSQALRLLSTAHQYKYHPSMVDPNLLDVRLLFAAYKHQSKYTAYHREAMPYIQVRTRFYDDVISSWCHRQSIGAQSEAQSENKSAMSNGENERCSPSPAVTRTGTQCHPVNIASISSNQVVLFGSGFDSRVYRLSALGNSSVFEIDQENVLLFKNNLLQQDTAPSFPSISLSSHIDHEPQNSHPQLSQSSQSFFATTSECGCSICINNASQHHHHDTVHPSSLSSLVVDLDKDQQQLPQRANWPPQQLANEVHHVVGDLATRTRHVTRNMRFQFSQEVMAIPSAFLSRKWFHSGEDDGDPRHNLLRMHTAFEQLQTGDTSVLEQYGPMVHISFPSIVEGKTPAQLSPSRTMVLQVFTLLSSFLFIKEDDVIDEKGVTRIPMSRPICLFIERILKTYFSSSAHISTTHAISCEDTMVDNYMLGLLRLSYRLSLLFTMSINGIDYSKAVDSFQTQLLQLYHLMRPFTLQVSTGFLLTKLTPPYPDITPTFIIIEKAQRPPQFQRESHRYNWLFGLLLDGYDPFLPTLFVIEGVLMYLTPIHVKELLSIIASLCKNHPSSQLLADTYSDFTRVSGKSYYALFKSGLNIHTQAQARELQQQREAQTQQHQEAQVAKQAILSSSPSSTPLPNQEHSTDENNDTVDNQHSHHDNFHPSHHAQKKARREGTAAESRPPKETSDETNLFKMLDDCGYKYAKVGIFKNQGYIDHTIASSILPQPQQQPQQDPPSQSRSQSQPQDAQDDLLSDLSNGQLRTSGGPDSSTPDTVTVQPLDDQELQELQPQVPWVSNTQLTEKRTSLLTRMSVDQYPLDIPMASPSSPGTTRRTTTMTGSTTTTTTTTGSIPPDEKHPVYSTRINDTIYTFPSQVNPTSKNVQVPRTAHDDDDVECNHVKNRPVCTRAFPDVHAFHCSQWFGLKQYLNVQYPLPSPTYVEHHHSSSSSSIDRVQPLQGVHQHDQQYVTLSSPPMSSSTTSTMTTMATTMTQLLDEFPPIFGISYGAFEASYQHECEPQFHHEHHPLCSHIVSTQLYDYLQVLPIYGYDLASTDLATLDYTQLLDRIDNYWQDTSIETTHITPSDHHSTRYPCKCQDMVKMVEYYTFLAKI